MRRIRRRSVGWAALALLVALLSVAAAGCGGDDDDGDAAPTGTTEGEGKPAGMMETLGSGEGRLDLVIWAGYAESGQTDPKLDWVTPFEQDTGCQVNTKVGGTSDEMVTLMRTGNYDGVSASGDATLRLIAGKDVAPVNTDLIPNYANVFDGLKDQPHNTVDGVAYGVPHGRGANLLQYRTDVVKPAPDSWSVVWEADSPYKGKVTAYDSPIYIADAAVYLKATQPDLGIEDPYALDQKQFDAAVDLLKQQRQLIGEYWSDYTKQAAAFTSGDLVVGTTWQVITNTLKGEKVPAEAVLPKEGSTGWSDTWMIASKAKHPNCMYMWMDYIIGPEGNAQATEYFGEAPVSQEACDIIADPPNAKIKAVLDVYGRDPKHCDTYHATDEAYFDQIAYWKTPVKDCGDDRGMVCKDYAEWTQAWTEIKG